MTPRAAFSRWRKSGAIVIGVLAVLFWYCGAQADETNDKASQFVRSLADRAIGSLTGQDISQAERNSRFRDLFVANFDVPAIGRSALGRFWRTATPEEQKKYLALFEDYIVMTYANRFREYSGEKLQVNDVGRAPDDTLAVKSQLVRAAGQPPVRVEWRLVPADSSFKIVDVVIEGVSMAQTQRSEFASVVSRNGGKVSGLISELRNKTEGLRASK
jgi:phospholipid transport system substrate-binding protein